MDAYICYDGWIEAVKFAFGGTIITMLFLGILALLISRIKQRRKQ